MPEAYSDSVEIVDRLFPKIVANHISKFPQLEGVDYQSVSELVADPEVPLNDRLCNVASFAGDLSIIDPLVHETGILRLCAIGREDEVQDNERKAAYAASDLNQTTDATSDKNLDHYLRNGVEIIFDQESREEARRYCAADTREVPLIEKLKAKRLFNINGFNDSRVMYTVHDMIDHAWLFDQMRDTGIMDSYADFLGSIEMGNDAFLYSRQAELLASVGFGSRRWSAASSQSEDLILGPQDVMSILKQADDPRLETALEKFKRMNPLERHQATYMIENMAVQFADERRRWGSVKIVESDGTRKPMELLDPIHISLMVETLSMLQRTRDYGKIQLAATLEVEDVLKEAIHDTNSPAIIEIPIPKALDMSSRAVGEHGKWIENHLNVSTSYNRIG